MKTFEVHLIRSINQVYRCIVEAEDEETAMQDAVSEGENTSDSDWENSGDGYDTEAVECHLIDSDQEDEDEDEDEDETEDEADG